jgi:AcrR family transcriptional regulator
MSKESISKKKASGGIELATTPKKRVRAPEATRKKILRAAKQVFAKYGYDGARIEKISKAAKSYDSLIYYHFGSKEKLFLEVLEDAYRDLFYAEEGLELDFHDPEGSLRAIVQFTFSYYLENPDLIVLLANENLHKGKHISKLRRARDYTSPFFRNFEKILKRGVEDGIFRSDLETQKIYIAMVALCYFYVSNRFTFSSFLDIDLMDKKEIESWKQFAPDLILSAMKVK